MKPLMKKPPVKAAVAPKKKLPPKSAAAVKPAWKGVADQMLNNTVC